MSKKPWNKHEKVEEEIIEILRKMQLATANVILFELKQRGYKISYGSVSRKLESLNKQERVQFLEIGGSKQKIWSIHNFLNQ